MSEDHRRSLASCQRKVVLQCIRAYQTVSSDAAVLLAGLIPITELIKERTYIGDVQRGRREKSPREIARRGKELLIGGKRNGRRAGRTKRDDERCMYGDEERDTPEHMLFHCIRFERVRQETVRYMSKTERRKHGGGNAEERGTMEVHPRNDGQDGCNQGERRKKT
ncbi:hypothetical protein HUJ05_007599 [Dendroctonus ponderosae]|nr:hypothetical protein HUJ05_007599 [Dendroctonus ponderosae]